MSENGKRVMMTMTMMLMNDHEVAGIIFQERRHYTCFVFLQVLQ